MPNKKKTGGSKRSHSSTKSRSTSSTSKRHPSSASQRTFTPTNPRSRSGGSTSKSLTRTSQFEELTKQELYERARRANVEGRSGMSKEQLMNALRRG